MNLPDFLTLDQYDEIRLTGSRIGLYTIVRRYKEGDSAEEMAAEYSWLPGGVIQKVIDFYFDNRDEVEAYVQAYRADLERQETEYDRSGRGEKMRQLSRLLRQADEQHKGDPEWDKLSIVEKLQRLGVETPSQERS